MDDDAPCLTVDRIDGGMVVLVDGEGVEAAVPRSWLEASITEGDSVRFEGCPDTRRELERRVRSAQQRMIDEDFEL